MSLRLHHVGLNVLDLDQAVAYWSAVTRLPAGPVTQMPERADLAQQVGLASSALRACRIAQPDAELEILELPPGSPTARRRDVNEPGITHVCVQLPQERGAFERLVEAGGTPHHPQHVELGTGIHYAYFRDAEHAVVELEQLPPARFAACHADDGTARLAHVGLATTMIDQLTDFYAEVLGPPVVRAAFEPREQFDHIAALEGVSLRWSSWLTDGDFCLEIWQYETPAPRADRVTQTFAEPGWSHVAFAVDDIEAERDRLVAAGATFDQPVVRGGLGALTFGHDPQGTLLELVELTNQESA